MEDEQISLFIARMKKSLGGLIQRRRVVIGLSQIGLAKLIGSSQSRVSKLEAGESNVTLDLQVRTLLALDTSGSAIGRAIRTS